MRSLVFLSAWDSLLMWKPLESLKFGLENLHIRTHFLTCYVEFPSLIFQYLQFESLQLLFSTLLSCKYEWKKLRNCHRYRFWNNVGLKTSRELRLED